MKTTVIKIIKEKNIVSLFSNFSFALFGLVSFMLLTRKLELEIFGKWVIFITASTLIDLFRFGITRTALLRFASGADLLRKKDLMGSSFLIGLSLCFLLFLISIISFIFNFEGLTTSNFYPVIIWYPVLALSNLPWNNAMSLLQAEEKFNKILIIRSIQAGSFVLYLLVRNNSSIHLNEIIIAFIISNFISSSICSFYRIDGLIYISYSTKKTIFELLHFGKYAMGTAIGSSLLRSVDTFLIGLSPVIGAQGVALYAVPLKLLDILEIPLRSFSATAFPKISKASINNQIDEVKNVFYIYTSRMCLLFIVLIIIAILLSKYLILFLGGLKYADHLDLMKAILLMFCSYGLFLPADRMTGIALDALNYPNYNFYKVMIMLVFNLIGDLIAIFIFKSLVLVALASFAFCIVGNILGLFFLRKIIDLHWSDFIMHTKIFIFSLQNIIK